MSAIAKSILVGTLGLLLALVLGYQLGAGEWLLPAGIILAALLAASYQLFGRGVRLEALTLGGLLIGYIVGNRGFAQLSLGGPFFLGELGMLICAIAFLLRMALTRLGPVPRTPLSWAIAAFMVLGAIRLAFDLYAKTGGSAVTAIRDSATVYYATFFFVAYRMGEIPQSRRLLERSLFLGFVVLLPVFFAEILFPDFMSRLSFRGVPLIIHKGDLAGALCGTACFYIYFIQRRTGKVWLCLVLSIAAFWEMIVASSRAAYVGWALGVVICFRARKARWTIAHVASLCVGLIALLSLQAAGTLGRENLAVRFSDKMASLTDVSGTSTNYNSEVGAVASANNRFRSAWWREVFDETMEKAPLTGLGFGYDLSKRFLLTYWGNTGGDPNTRSPHNIVFTLLGRMGTIGVLSFALIVWLVVLSTYRAASDVRHRKAPVSALRAWIGVVIFLTASAFGVVLEGPMGGVVFWSLLGLAASGMSQTTPKVTMPAEEKQRMKTMPLRPALTLASPH